MPNYKDTTYKGERALFATNNAELVNCVFEDGESPLKESKNLKLYQCEFKWKYPVWYSKDVLMENCTLRETARSGIWYTKNITMRNCLIEAPKTFRYAEKVVLESTDMVNAKETLWNCKDIKISKAKINGDYFGFHSENIEIDNVEINGNYAFDSVKNIVVTNPILNSKDSFWNAENVTIVNSTIIGEYLGWNSKNVKLVNCHIESHQGLCYMDDIKLINCELVNSDLCFEYCSNIFAEITTEIDSIKNPYSGMIKAKGVKELILDDQFVDPKKTVIKVEK